MDHSHHCESTDHSHGRQSAGDEVLKPRSPDWPFLDLEGRVVSFLPMTPPKGPNRPLVSSGTTPRSRVSESGDWLIRGNDRPEPLLLRRGFHRGERDARALGVAIRRVVTCSEDGRVAQSALLLSVLLGCWIRQSASLCVVDLWNEHHCCLPSLHFLACSLFAFSWRGTC